MAGLKVYELGLQGALLSTDWLVIQKGTDPAKKTPLSEILSNGLFFSGVQKAESTTSGMLVKDLVKPVLQLKSLDTALLEQDLACFEVYQSDPSGTGVGVVGQIASVNESAFSGIAGWEFRVGAANALIVALKLLANGKVNMPNLPISAAGLSAGDIWNDAGTLKII